MPDEAVLTSGVAPVGRAQLASNLRALGVRPGTVLMVHARVSALGWVVGGTGAVVQALLDAVGPDGTVMAYAGWEDDPYGMDRWPEAWQRAYEAQLPPFDPLTAEAVHANGRLPERIRTWPGAQRSRQPEAGIVALGRQAAWIVADHPLDDAYGAGSPLAKLVEADGQVLALGAPLSTLTLLHHAEATAQVDGKHRVRYRMPLLVDGRTIWHEFQDIDTAEGAFPYELVAAEIAATPGIGPDQDPFEAIARHALAAGIGTEGRVGGAASALFPARDLHRFAETWLEERFGDSHTAGEN
ncbi:MAG: aminoglycoside 3-N-acetyltransferase [Thermomicrobiales bacterium]